MVKWRRTWLFLLAQMVVALAVYFEPTHCVRGWLHGEAFFDGRPTSWWRIELERYKIHRDKCGDVYFYPRDPTLFERTRDRWLPREMTDEDAREIINGPRILRVNDEAVSVLRELLDDPSPKVRDFAQFGLRLNGKSPDKD